MPGGDHAPAVAGGLGSCTMRQQRISAQPPPAASSHGETPNHSAMVGSRGAASPPRGGTAGCSTESGNNEQHRIPQIRVATAGDSAHAAGRNPTQSQPDIDSRERHAIRERLRARRGASCIAELRRHLITPFIERSGPLGHSWLRLHPMVRRWARRNGQGSRGRSWPLTFCPCACDLCRSTSTWGTPRWLHPPQRSRRS